jgi:hypothetical protein
MPSVETSDVLTRMKNEEVKQQQNWVSKVNMALTGALAQTAYLEQSWQLYLEHMTSCMKQAALGNRQNSRSWPIGSSKQSNLQ